MDVKEIFMERVIFELNFEGWMRNAKISRESREYDIVRVRDL